MVAEDEQNTVAEALGVSAILVQDLKEYRQNNYKFSWERMLNFNGDTGVFLQYTHARLHRLTTCSAMYSLFIDSFSLLIHAYIYSAINLFIYILYIYFLIYFSLFLFIHSSNYVLFCVFFYLFIVLCIH